MEDTSFGSIIKNFIFFVIFIVVLVLIIRVFLTFTSGCCPIIKKLWGIIKDALFSPRIKRELIKITLFFLDF